jgi:hypothetical protein
MITLKVYLNGNIFYFLFFIVTLYPLITAKNNAEDVSESWPRSITTTNSMKIIYSVNIFPC